MLPPVPHPCVWLRILAPRQRSEPLCRHLLVAVRLTLNLKTLKTNKILMQHACACSGVFLDYARRSTHRPVSVEEELAMLIYNYHAVFTARDIVMEPSYDGALPRALQSGESASRGWAAQLPACHAVHAPWF